VVAIERSDRRRSGGRDGACERLAAGGLVLGDAGWRELRRLRGYGGVIVTALQGGPSMDHLTFTRSVTFGRRSISEIDWSSQAGLRWWGLP